VRDVYSRSPPMSSYLVCFAVSEFKVAMADPSLYRIPVGVWAPPHLIDRGEATFSPDFSAKLMKALEEYYQIPYPLPKMDEISIPNFSSGAMENWGLNTYRFLPANISSPWQPKAFLARSKNGLLFIAP
jgi:aminopeptidase N